MCICMAQSLHYSPETITALFVNQLHSNQNFKNLKRNKGKRKKFDFPGVIVILINIYLPPTAIYLRYFI